MNTVAIWEFRANLSSYLKQLDNPSQVLSFWHRNKKEYLVSKFPEIEEGFDIFKYQAWVVENNLQKDYYKSLSTNYSDWSNSVHDDLFE